MDLSHFFIVVLRLVVSLLAGIIGYRLASRRRRKR